MLQMVYEQNKTKISKNKTSELAITIAVIELTKEDEVNTIPKKLRMITNIQHRLLTHREESINQHHLQLS